MVSSYFVKYFGYLRQKHSKIVLEARIRNALPRLCQVFVSPAYTHQRWANTTSAINPIPRWPTTLGINYKSIKMKGLRRTGTNMLLPSMDTTDLCWLQKQRSSRTKSLFMRTFLGNYIYETNIYIKNGFWKIACNDHQAFPTCFEC